MRTVTFQPGVTLRIRLVKLRYSMGGPAVTHEPSGTDVALIESWLRRAYPVSRVQLSTVTVTAAASPPFTADQANAQLIALRGRRQHRYGRPHTLLRHGRHGQLADADDAFVGSMSAIRRWACRFV
jgi:hypothetical protein